jgi:hypothetical protein
VHVACTGLVYEKDIFMRRKFSLFLGGPRSNFKRGIKYEKEKVYSYLHYLVYVANVKLVC